MKKITFLIILIFSSFSFSQSQIEVNGYLQNMQTVWAPKQTDFWVFSNSITNRFNFTYYPSSNLTFNLGMRNIFDYGEFVSMVPNYNESAIYDDGILDLTTEVTSNKSAILYSNIDRLNLFYSANNFELQIGRQRVNLSINSVWTPNDIFNSSSFLNFDYLEKPGSDAIRIQYHLDYASSIQLITKANKAKQLTFAAIYKFNQWDYDFQTLAGLTVDDYIFGGGWSGDILGAGFTGEATYFNSRNKFNDIFLSSIGTNYTFSNSLFLMCEFLYNSNGIVGKVNSINNLFNLEYSAKNLSPARYSIFTSLQYPITPLFNASAALILNPSDGSFFVNPSADISISQDVYILISGQFFLGGNYTEWGEYGQFYYLRIKWNF